METPPSTSPYESLAPTRPSLPLRTVGIGHATAHRRPLPALSTSPKCRPRSARWDTPRSLQAIRDSASTSMDHRPRHASDAGATTGKRCPVAPRVRFRCFRKDMQHPTGLAAAGPTTGGNRTQQHEHARTPACRAHADRPHQYPIKPTEIPPKTCFFEFPTLKTGWWSPSFPPKPPGDHAPW